MMVLCAARTDGELMLCAARVPDRLEMPPASRRAGGTGTLQLPMRLSGAMRGGT